MVWQILQIFQKVLKLGTADLSNGAWSLELFFVEKIIQFIQF